MKRTAAAFVGLILGLALAACTSSGPKPADDFLARPVVVADPGWNHGKPIDLGLTLQRFSAALGENTRWEKEPDGSWKATTVGPVPGLGDKVETTYRFTASNPAGSNAALLAEVHRGTKTFSPAEIWGVATATAKSAAAKKP